MWVDFDVRDNRRWTFSLEEALLWIMAVVFKPVLQAPLPCTFCMSPLSDTPDSTHQLVSRDCKTWIGCVWQGRHTKCAGQGCLQDRFENHWIMDLYFNRKRWFKVKTSYWWICLLQTHSFCLLKMLTDGLEWCGLLVDYCDVFISCLDSHSDGTHSLQRIHCWTSDVMLHFSKSDEETNSSTSWITFSENFQFWLNYSFVLVQFMKYII